ncbi:MAG: sensor histidine kinase [Myxococcota bacterium]
MTGAPHSDDQTAGTRTTSVPETQGLATALRNLASITAEQAGGGLSLVFAAAPGEDSRKCAATLRTAAGFATPQAAREAAQMLLPQVRNALGCQTRESLCALPSLGARAAGGLEIYPLAHDGRARGALVVGIPEPLSAERQGSLSDSVRYLSLLLDHADLAFHRNTAVETPEDDDAPVDQSEEVLKLSEALFAQDIELLRSNEKLGKIEKLKNDFIEKMSRELRTPLNSIIEGIISVLTGENDSLSDGAKQTLRSALDEGSAFLRTLQNILDLWRIKQNELPVEIHDMNFRETVEEAIFSIQDGIGEKPIAVEQHIQEPFPKIRTDLTKINQILFLLLDNAVKFTPEGTIEIRASVDDSDLLFEVQDTGVGICADDQQYIFDEFFQVDVASSRTYSGAGLGLALVRDLIVLLDGEVAVTSDVGRGSNFSVRIPVQLAG